ncbi:MAG: C25 family cysteine peptidase [Saprospiraceae bacterium]|nr:C25 family cysteine peptidase [Saprospiraceae bacterium]
MKNIFLLLLVFCSSLLLAQGLDVQVSVLSQTQTKTVLAVSIDEANLETLNWNEQSLIVPLLTDGTPILKTGYPEMFRLSENILLQGNESAVVKIKDVTYLELNDVDVLPSKGNLYRDTDPATIALNYGKIYNESGLYPKQLAGLSTSYRMRGVSGQTLWLNPVQYDAANKTLRVSTSFTVEIIDEQTQSTIKSISKGQQEILSKRFLNYSNLEARYDPISEVGSMLVISAADYMESVEDLVDWKIRKGMETTLIDVADIGDTSEDILNYIQEFYDNNNLAYVLLVGDENAIPTLQTSNNNACDHCYSYVDGDDHYADIFVGRFNGENAEHIRTMVDRTLEYEINPNTDVDWMSKAIGLGSNEGPGDDGEYDYEHLNNLKIQMLDYNFTEIFECYQGSNAQASPTIGEPSADLDGGPSTQSLIDHIDNGVSFLNYTGHGGHTALSTGGYDIDAVDQQANNGRYPYLVAVACCVGDFQNDFGAGPCLGDAWIRATDNSTGLPTGGIGGVFSSILQSWAPPMEGQDEMTNILTENALYPTRHTIGGVSLMGMASMIDAYEGGGIDMADTWNIFGDPSVVLRTAMPQQLVVNHAPFVSINAGSISIACEVEGATIAASHEGTILGVGTVENGLLNLELNNIAGPITFILTGTAYNHIPYQSEVSVTVDAGVYMISSINYVNDANGNDNGLADYSEQVSVDLDFSNVGLADADGLSAEVTTTSTDVVMLNGTIPSIPSLIQGTNTIVTDAFSFEVNGYVLDGVIVPFQIEITDGVDIWYSNVSVMLHAPKLAIDELVDMSDEASTQSNGRFDAGETVTITIEVENAGSADLYTVNHLLTEDSPYITIDEASIVSNTLANGDLVSLEFDVSADASVPINHKVNFDFSSESGNYADDIEFDLSVNLNLEDFEDDVYIAEYISDGLYPWFTDYTNSVSGTSSMRSGDIDDEQLSEMTISIDVVEAGDLIFNSRVSTEEGYDYLVFYINDVEVGAWSGEIPWSSYSFPLDVGQYDLRWSYTKDFTVSSGDDAVWVDDVIFPLLADPVSISEIPESTLFRVYPNPGNGLFNLKMDDSYFIEIKDLTGRQVLQFGALEQESQIDCSELKKGVYILSARNNELEINKKIIIQ